MTLALPDHIVQAIDKEAMRFRTHLEKLMQTGDGSIENPYVLMDPSQQLIILRLLDQRAQSQAWLEDARGNLECITSLVGQKIHFLHKYEDS